MTKMSREVMRRTEMVDKKREVEGRFACLRRERSGVWREREGRKKDVLRWGRGGRDWAPRTAVRAAEQSWLWSALKPRAIMSSSWTVRNAVMKWSGWGIG